MTITKWALPVLALLCAPVMAQTAAPPAQQHTAVAIDPSSFDRYAGYYQLGAQLAVRLWRENDRYFFGTFGTPQRQELFPESPTQFFLKNVPVTLTFKPEADGKITGMTVNQAGRDIQAPRIDEVVAQSLTAVPAGHPMPRTWKALTLTARPLTSQAGGSMDYWPCFSPDGKTVLFSRTMDGGKNWTLLRVPAAGGEPAPFAKLAGSATRASWSAKTGRIVFDLDGTDGSHAIWVINGDGSGAHAVAISGASLPGYPSWYADGKSIAYGESAQNILYRVKEDGGAPTAITSQAQVLTGMSSVSPDGKWIAFAGQKNNGQVYNQGENQIWLVDDSGTARLLEASPLPGRTPSWSPDGQRIAFESDRGSPDGHYAAFIINRDGSGLTQATDYALNASHPVFSPDGRRLVMAIGDPARNISTIAIVDLP